MLHQAAIDLDRVLTELDDLARSNATDEVFYRQLMLQFHATVQPSAATIAIPATENNWIARATLGEIDPGFVDSLRSANYDEPASLQQTRHLTGRNATDHWYAYAVSPNNLAKGVLVAIYAKPLSESERVGLAEIQLAFCEIISERQSIAIDRFFAEDMTIVHETCRAMELSDEKFSAAQTLVNGIACIVNNCRVSISEVSSFGGCTPIAVSAISKLDQKSFAFHQLQSLCEKTAKQKSILTCRTNTAQEQSPQENRNQSNDTIFIPFSTHDDDIRWILGLEFSSPEAYARDCAKLPFVLPALSTAWRQKLAWLDIPLWIRKIPFSTSRMRSSARSITKFGIIAVASLIFGIWLLIPKALLVEAEGVLLPSEAKAIFASADGFVSQLLVTDNQMVEAGQLLITLTSPSVELQLEELYGKMQTLEEESRGIEIALNQIDPNTDDSLKQQSLMASKLKDIAIQQESLQRQKAILQRQSQDLEIRSPIKGISVGKDLKQNLLGRPVNRGELLFRVMDITSQWELRLKVADQDSKYVTQQFQLNSSDAAKQLEFVLDSAPKERHAAKVKSIGNRVENIHREGNFLEVRADIVELTDENKKVGSNVHAYFNCGNFPTWFVWFRPAIEAARRKLWF